MKTKIIAALAVAGTLVAACSESNNSLTDSGTGQVNVMLTDAPFPFSQVKSVDVYVVRIDGKLAETDSAQAANVDSAG